MILSSDEIEILNARFSEKAPEEVLTYFLNTFGEKIALSSSLSIEDQTLTDMILKIRKDTKIFTLDTGRLFPETYSLIDRTNMKYGIKLKVYFPKAENIEKMVSENSGVNFFYESIEKRHLCCQYRKLEPLKRAFEGLDVWICGLRKEQSVTRHGMKMIEQDTLNGLIKLNPLINWTEEQVWNYIKTYSVPYNKLYDKGFASIGCQPCTRAIAPGEDVRSGRWWWEDPEHRECGLHKR